MVYKAKYKRLSYLLEMLQKEHLKTPLDICRKFECSDKTARRMLNDLREEGYEIFYSRKQQKYLLTVLQTVKK